MKLKRITKRGFALTNVWEGFQRPFKDGDIIFTHANCLKVGLGNTWISIFQEMRNGGVATYVDMAEDGSDYYDYLGDKGLLCMDKGIMRIRLATEEEKAKLFQAIKDKGYKWNEETKTLEKLFEPKFKVGDRIVHKENRKTPFVITEITKQSYKGGTQFEVLIEQQDNFELVPTVVPKFKVGDTITNGKTSITIGYIDNEYYYETCRNIANRLFIKNQDEWNLISEKYPKKPTALCDVINAINEGCKYIMKETMEPQNKGMTIDIQVSELAGYVFYIDGKQVQYEDMTRQQQIKVLNSFSQGYKLFERFLKQE